ncbi:MAG TPA: SRPBCC family protein [Mesorhizobium sp.]|jgi:uncharacterized protein YndB with AHSA1/START domain|nr:SRPBCC family protein [Mesorhizobium sp.]
MTEQKAVHATIVLERSYDAPPSRVFEAFADPAARMRWGVPSPSVRLVYDEADFRVGGRDLSRCGPAGNLKYRVETLYRDIVPDQRIISTEVVNEGETRLAVSQITVEFKPSAAGTRLVLSDQIAALSGADMIAGSKHGYSKALENLAIEVARENAIAGQRPPAA